MKKKIKISHPHITIKGILILFDMFSNNKNNNIDNHVQSKIR